MNQPRCKLGEGLHIDSSGNLWWVDILSRQLICADEAGVQIFGLPEMASKVLKVTAGTVILASETGLAEFDIGSQTWRLIARQPPLTWDGEGRSNDACLLPDGSALVGRMDHDPRRNTGDVVRYCEGQASVVLTDIAIPNSFIVLNQEQEIIISDSYEGLVYSCKIDKLKNGRLSTELWCDFRSGLGTPDGGILGRDGFVYLAMWGGACVVKLTQKGELLGSKKIPALNPTSIQQNEAGTLMYVTSATDTMTKDEIRRYPMSGYMLRVTKDTEYG